MNGDRPGRGRRAWRRWRSRLARAMRSGTRGATSLEYTLLLLVIVLPSFALIMSALGLLIEHYRMMTMLNSMPFP